MLRPKTMATFLTVSAAMAGFVAGQDPDPSTKDRRPIPTTLAPAADTSAFDAAVLRLAALLRIEDLRLKDPAAWAAVDGAADERWVARVAVARKRVFEDPFAPGTPPAADEAAAAALLQAFGAAKDDALSLRRAAHDLTRFRGKLPAAAVAALKERLAAPDGDTAGFVARALAKTEGAGEAEATAITAAYLDGGDRIAQIDRLRALAALPGGPARAAILDAVKSPDAHLRRTGFETAAAVAESLAERDRKGLGSIAAAAIEADPVPDVRGAAVEALAAVDNDRFFDAMERFRFAEPWTVRAAAAGKVGLFGFNRAFGGDGGFARDPDRRVRQAMFEAATKDIAARGAGARTDLLSPSFRMAVLALLGDGAAEPKLRMPSDGDDPIDVGLRAAFLAALVRAKAAPDLGEARRFVALADAAIPWFEIEPRQMVIDLAAALVDLGPARVAASAAADVAALERFAAKERDPTLRAYAAAALAKIASGPGAATRTVVEDPRSPESIFTEADYKEAAARALGSKPVTATVRTNQGSIVLTLRADLAPLTVHNFIRLAKRGYYDGVLFHRVVPGFVAQAGCPRGDGFGGPGYAIRCETSDAPYERGVLGMALAGKDTGGSQWFLTHRSTPHLNGKYTVFGKVEQGFEALDALVQGDRIRSITIEE